MGAPLRVTFVSKSDLQGGAAVVTFRLMEAMRGLGVDARMLVCEKMSESPYVMECASKREIKWKFIKERLEVLVLNGGSRKTLFKIDTAEEGLPLWRHEWVKEADAVVLGWVNQGMLSLRGVGKIAESGKRLIWTMHDMWNMTGVCHHAGECTRYKGECGECPLLGMMKGKRDASRGTWKRKRTLYEACGIRFVAVSSWLARKAAESGLMSDQDVRVIPNAFPIGDEPECTEAGNRDGKVRMIFGAARLDDSIKGLSVLLEALRRFAERYPGKAERFELVTFGAMKDNEWMERVAVEHTHLGVLRGGYALRTAYEGCDIVVSASDYETLPGTLIEGQAYGCIPVAFDHGGQRDIIEHKATGYLADWADDAGDRAEMLAEGISWAFDHSGDAAMRNRMRKSVRDKFSAGNIAREFISLIKE